MNERARAFEVERAKSFGGRRRKEHLIGWQDYRSIGKDAQREGARVKGTFTKASPSHLRPNLVPNLKYHSDSHGYQPNHFHGSTIITSYCW